ncbi:MAG: OmpA family protein [Bacteroidota bacterium]
MLSKIQSGEYLCKHINTLASIRDMKKYLKIFFIFYFSFFVFRFSFAQQKYSSENKKAIKYYEEALRYYDGMKLEEARQYLLKSIIEDDKFVESHTMLGYIYSDLQQPQKAIKEIQKAISIDPNFFPGNYFSLGRLLIGTGKYKDAEVIFEKYLSSSPSNPDMKKMAQRDVLNCEFAMGAIQNPVPFKPENMGYGINSANDEYFPSITADENTFLFTRKLPAPAGKGQGAKDGWQEDFFINTKVNGKWDKVHGIGANINTDGNEGAPCLSADGQILFFVACENDFGYGAKRKGYGSCDIFFSFRNGGDWMAPENLGAPVNSPWWETQPSFASDGKTLYFIRGVVDKNRKRQKDIWSSTLGDDGKWSNPTKLSDIINTSGNEESVFIHSDNQTLYFSSDGHPGMGGLDIFVSRRQPNGEWGPPVNLGYPINTFNDENSLLVSRNGKHAYFASDREGGYGGLDMYQFELYESAQPIKTTYLKGKVIDAVTKQPLEANIDVIDLKTGKTYVKWSSNNMNGEFLICLPLNRDYAFNVSKEKYLFHSENFSLIANKNYDPVAITIPLSLIAVDSTVILKNVFFETAEYNLKDESRAELNKLISFLNNNKTMKIELSGHTDNVGDKKSNQILSANRAKSVYEYLVVNNIFKERLTYKGYGDTKPVVPNDSDEHRQMNRRTEFKVIAE